MTVRTRQARHGHRKADCRQPRQCQTQHRAKDRGWAIKVQPQRGPTRPVMPVGFRDDGKGRCHRAPPRRGKRRAADIYHGGCPRPGGFAAYPQGSRRADGCDRRRVLRSPQAPAVGGARPLRTLRPHQAATGVSETLKSGAVQGGFLPERIQCSCQSVPGASSCLPSAARPRHPPHASVGLIDHHRIDCLRAALLTSRTPSCLPSQPSAWRTTSRQSLASTLIEQPLANLSIYIVYTLEPRRATMIVEFCRWGNSLAVRIPKVVADALKVSNGRRAEIIVENGTLVLRPLLKPTRKPRYTIEELLSGMTRENVPQEVDWGPPRGNEAW